ncbi:MAG: bifunctional UDP-N-acetylmuramoyl-tripeptide:D-alanyl-D-alanine ligase/alanine racemase [Bacteroidota bacterium]
MYSIHSLNVLLKGRLLNAEYIEYEIDQLLFDSRQLVFPHRSLFFALKGPRQDGHQFIPELYAQGLRNFIVAKVIPLDAFPGANFILVAEPLRALQQLAEFHRQQFRPTCIGITGSNGKTIIKEWLFQLLCTQFNIVRSPKSYNSQIGVPLSVWQMNSKDELAIFEAGISQKGEMQYLAPIIDCEIGIFTNIGTAHDEGFLSQEEKIIEKLALFKGAKVLIYQKDQSALSKIIEDKVHCSLFSWSSTRPEADLYITDIDLSQQKQSSITALFDGRHIDIEFPFSDPAAIENAIHCWACLLLLQQDHEWIKKRMRQLVSVAMRLELKAGINNCQLINDSYNSDLTSLSIALNFLDQQDRQQKRSVILSDILQSGQASKNLYREVADLLLQKDIHRLIGIGENIPIIQPYLKDECHSAFFKDTNAFLGALREMDFQDEIILLKGARPFQFERIANRLEQKVHQTILEINLSALQHNLNVYRQIIRPSTQMMVMVKAAAYGSGSEEIARLLAYQKVDYLCVAYADEGVALRKAGLKLPIMVLNPEVATFDVMARYRLEPEIYSLRLLDQLLSYLPPQAKPFSIHIKLETGMNRLGFATEELPDLLAILQNQAQLEVQSIFSHLTASENNQYDSFTKKQANQFLDNYAFLAQGLGHRPVRHLLNSSGIVRFPQYQLDMVRLGIGLYGIDGSATIQEQLQVVHCLKASISQIRTVQAHEGIGYGLKGQLVKPGRIATISIGYADGLLRSAGNGRFSVKIRGQKAPIIGQVCMDMCMVDISHLPQACEGDEVIIFGANHSVNQLAECLQTIPYEVFTNISTRVKRVYFQE